MNFFKKNTISLGSNHEEINAKTIKESSKSCEKAMGKSINQHKPQVTSGYLRVEGIPLDSTTGSITFTTTNSTMYMVSCDCKKHNGGFMPVYNCSKCNGNGYQLITEEEYNKLQEEHKRNWQYCPHCGEKLNEEKT